MCRHRIAPQQVSNVDFLNILDSHPATGQIGEIRHAADMQRKTLEQIEDFPAPGPGGGWQGQQDLLRTGDVDHFLNVLGFIDMQTRDRTVSDTGIIVDESHGAHDLAHAQRGNQLIAGDAAP